MPHDVNYDSTWTPPTYICETCGKGGVKLWREYQCFRPSLYCLSCAQASQGQPIEAGSAVSESIRLGFIGKTRTGHYRFRGRRYGTKREVLRAVDRAYEVLRQA